VKDFFVQLLVNHQYVVYAIIIVFACIEGPILSIIFGTLIQAKLVDFFPIYAALILGDVLGDTIWYYVGYYVGHPFIKRFGKYVSVTESKVLKISTVFHRHKDWIIFVSKITNGFGFSLVTLITAGIVKIPFGRYIFFNFLGQFLWTGLLIVVGYFFSNLYTQIDNWLGRASLLGLFIVLCFIFVGYTKYLRNKIAESTK
jgi:membrane protein DedA with SNARE-associated domain